jgi:hypothetical protein
VTANGNDPVCTGISIIREFIMLDLHGCKSLKLFNRHEVFRPYGAFAFFFLPPDIELDSPGTRVLCRESIKGLARLKAKVFQFAWQGADKFDFHGKEI